MIVPTWILEPNYCYKIWMKIKKKRLEGKPHQYLVWRKLIVSEPCTQFTFYTLLSGIQKKKKTTKNSWIIAAYYSCKRQSSLYFLSKAMSRSKRIVKGSGTHSSSQVKNIKWKNENKEWGYKPIVYCVEWKKEYIEHLDIRLKKKITQSGPDLWRVRCHKKKIIHSEPNWSTERCFKKKSHFESKTRTTIRRLKENETFEDWKHAT